MIIRRHFLGAALILWGILNAGVSGRADNLLEFDKIATTAYSKQFQSTTQSLTVSTNDALFWVPEEYPIPIIVDEDLSSEELQNGQRVKIFVAKDIYISNVLVFKKGAKGVLLVKSVRPARNLGKGGYIIFQKGYITDASGMLRVITLKQKITGKRCVWAGIISHAMIWNPIGWIFAIKEGEPAYINSGDEFTAFVSEDFQFKK